MTPAAEQANVVAQTIAQQMGGTGRLSMFTGAHTFLSAAEEEGALSFKFPRPSAGKPNFLKITLTYADTYKMEFGSIHGLNYKVIKRIDGVFCSDLVEIFERETGLYLSF